MFGLMFRKTHKAVVHRLHDDMERQVLLTMDWHSKAQANERDAEKYRERLRRDREHAARRRALPL